MPIRYTLKARFWAKVDRSNLEGCWLWVGAQGARGYGLIKRSKYVQLSAHRVAWELDHGQPVPVGLQVLHDCRPFPDNKLCVRPSHLWVGTVQDNMRDAQEKGQIKYRRGKDHPQSGLKGEMWDLVRKLYSRGNISQRWLASHVEVSPVSIQTAVRDLPVARMKGGRRKG